MVFALSHTFPIIPEIPVQTNPSSDKSQFRKEYL
jgi:hypothetical protein